MVSWPRAQVIQACKDLSVRLPRVSGVDPVQLLIALALSESSLGDNCGPRFEPSWYTGGELAKNPFQKSLIAMYDRGAAMSYGPWQVMFYNLSALYPSVTPETYNTDFETVSKMSITFLANQITKWKPASIEAIGWLWNGGNLTAPFVRALPAGVVNYGRQLHMHYDEALVFLEAKDVADSH